MPARFANSVWLRSLIFRAIRKPIVDYPVKPCATHCFMSIVDLHSARCFRASSRELIPTEADTASAQFEPERYKGAGQRVAEYRTAHPIIRRGKRYPLTQIELAKRAG